MPASPKPGTTALRGPFLTTLPDVITSGRQAWTEPAQRTPVLGYSVSDLLKLIMAGLGGGGLDIGGGDGALPQDPLLVVEY